MLFNLYDVHREIEVRTYSVSGRKTRTNIEIIPEISYDRSKLLIGNQDSVLDFDIGFKIR